MKIFRKVVLKNLKENKTRTIVTIIGIILSLSMFTAVTTSVSSGQHYLLTTAIMREGNWHGCMDVTREERKTLLNHYFTIDKVTYLEHIGYARLTDGANPDKPYLYISGMDESTTDMLPIHVTSGRLPENDRELLIPEHLSYNGGVNLALGDVLTLQVGSRLSVDSEGNPWILDQQMSYLYTEEERKSQEDYDGSPIDPETVEQLTDTREQTYTVVGFYERPSFENYSAPGYTALTFRSSLANADGDPDTMYDAYILFADPLEAEGWLAANAPRWSATNSDVLRQLGGGESSYRAVLYSLAAILIFIIIFGSVALIYNAFSISVTERTKQFGLLSSIGATRRQLIHSVLFEAAFLCIIGIPIGILSGTAGIGITFHFLGATVASFVNGNTSWNVPLTLHIAPGALAIAAAIGLATVLVSAFFPILRTTRLSPIEAIRMTADINVRPRKVRTSRLTLKLFGLPGMLASKNFKRNRRKYRATVISLFVSLVLFISASSFSSYLMDAADNVLSDTEADISYSYYPTQWEDVSRSQRLLSQFYSLDSITQAAAIIRSTTFLYLDPNDLSREYLNYYGGTVPEDDGRLRLYTNLYFVDDDAFQAYLEQQGLSPADFMDPSHPRALISDFIRVYDDTSGKYKTCHVFASSASDISMEIEQIVIPEGIEAEYYNVNYDDDHKPSYEFYDSVREDYVSFPLEDCTVKAPADIGSLLTDVPYFLGDLYSSSLLLIYPESCRTSILPETAPNLHNINGNFMFTASDHTKAMDDLAQILRDNHMETHMLFDYVAEKAQNRSLVIAITVFSYGFIILISLIAAANVFNTISTNILLRRRDFAMLRSTGMDRTGFRRMMCFECLLYGLKGMLYGLPVSLLINLWIYHSIAKGWDTPFYLPWQNYVIAIFSVFAVVGSTMIYSMNKIKKENIVDELKVD